MKHNIPKPYGSYGDYIQLEGYWVPLGTLESTVSDSYILTKSVKKNLKDLVRIVSIGQLPVLLQVLHLIFLSFYDFYIFIILG